MTLPETPDLPAGSVVITPTQIYAEVRAMGQKVDHLATMLDPALTTLREDIRDLRDDIDKDVAEVRGHIRDGLAAAKLAHDDMNAVAKLAHDEIKREAKIVHDDHENRLRSLDKRVWVAAIVTAVVGAGSGAGIAQLIPLLTK